MMNRFLTAACAATMVFAAGCGSSGGGARADIYLIDGTAGAQGFIYSVDLSTDPITVAIAGQVTSDDGDVLPMTGLAIGPGGVVIGTTSADADSNDLLVTIDLDTGAAEEIDYSGDTDCIYGVNDLAFAGDTLYGVTGEDNTNCIITIDEDGEVTETDTFASYGGALAYDAAGDILHFLDFPEGLEDATLNTIDLDDGSIVDGDDITGGDDLYDDYPQLNSAYVKGMAFAGGRLLAITGSDYGVSLLIEIDPEDGTFEVLGIVPIAADAIAAAN
ncbi:MAG: hypothetical protein KIT79_06635 [Deltaproteobacteria bacterium]|nr:hypothetical protein [Deltaproteobacteria bacterium]